LDGQYFDPETRRLMGVAFEMTLAALRLEDRADPIVGSVADKIVELARSGERDANSLCEWTLTELNQPPPRRQPSQQPVPLHDSDSA
jgi:hypothetical protein